MAEPIFALEHISFTYPGGRQVFRDMDFALYPDRKIGLYGPNGSGKTTFFRLIMGLAAPQEGRILFHGRPLETEKDFRELRCKVGLVLQHAEDQLFCPTVLEDVAFGPLNLGCTQDEARDRAASTLERLGLARFENRLTHRLSGGEKKLVSLATVLVMEPEALLLDEPTNGLDPEARQRIIGVLKTLPTARIIISHDWDFLAETSSEYLTVEGQHFTDAAPSHAHACASSRQQTARALRSPSHNGAARQGRGMKTGEICGTGSRRKASSLGREKPLQRVCSPGSGGGAGRS